MEMSNELFASKGLKRKSLKCCVSSCEDPTNLETSFHSFPMDKVLQRTWLDILKIQELNDGMKVCGAHFNSDDFFPTLGEFKTHKLKVKRLKRTAVPTLRLPVKHEPASPIHVSEEENDENENSVGSRVSPEQSEADKYTIGSYVCTSCGHLSTSETSFFEHLNSHAIKQEPHSRGVVKVEDESFFLPEDDDSTPDVDPFDQVTHSTDAAVETVEDDDAEETKTEVEEDYGDSVGESEASRECIPPNSVIYYWSRGSRKAKIIDADEWRKLIRFGHYPPFTKEKLKNGDREFWRGVPRCKCFHCPFLSHNPRLFYAHLQLHSEGKNCVCLTCQIFSLSQEDLIRAHTVSNGCTNIRILDFRFRCDYCWEFLKSRTFLFRHMFLCYNKIKAKCVTRT